MSEAPLVLVGGSLENVGLARERAGEGKPVVVLLDPAAAVLSVALWRALAAEGIGLGADPLSPYADGGELPLWPLAAVAHEIEGALRFFRDVLDVPCAGVGVPGPNPVCAEGDYRALLDATGLPQFAVSREQDAGWAIS